MLRWNTMAQKTKILVVDDQEYERATLARGLSESGFEVILADGGPMALKLLESESTDVKVVLTDMQMPGMTGIELTRKIKSMHPNLDIIVITAQGEIDIVVEAIQAGATNYIIKPPKIQEVKQRIDRLLEQQARLQVGNERRELSILFSDIRGFTELSEKTELNVLSRFLNEYLGAMTEVLRSNQGTLDKYIGDALMGFWGAPLELGDHASLAVKTAIDMLVKLRELNAGFLKTYGFTIDAGIAINSGPAFVGNIGSKKNSGFTAIGDNVNLASRLEGVNRYYRTRIVISENTYALLKANEFLCREMDTVKVIGKLKPVKIYEVFPPTASMASLKESLQAYDAGLRHYYSREWNQAISHFQAALRAREEDGAASELLDRCRKYLENPPGDDWDGIWEMKLK
jgi:class 3 adenylate cyclase